MSDLEEVGIDECVLHICCECSVTLCLEVTDDQGREHHIEAPDIEKAEAFRKAANAWMVVAIGMCPSCGEAAKAGLQ